MGEAAHRSSTDGASAEYRHLYERYYPQVFAYCVRRADRQDARDLAAEVFAVAWTRRESIPEGDEALSWLYAVAHHVVLHHWRSQGRRRRLTTRLASVPTERGVELETVVVQHRDYELVLEAASRLRPKDQEVLRLALWDELSHQQIADLLKTSIPAVRQRLYRARRALAREFERIGGTIPPTAVARKGGEQ